MHPVSRILCLIALAAGLAMAAPAALALATLLLLGLGALARFGSPIWRPTFYRLRWIFLSLLVLYAWFTPGRPVWPDLGAFSPTWTGLELWLLRCWMLWVMAAAARLLMQTTPRADLIAALYWLLRPLSWLGLKPERFCLRLVLTLEYALAQQKAVPSPRDKPAGEKPIRRAARLVQEQFLATERQAAQASLESVNLPHRGAPPWYEWLYPIALLSALIFATGVSP